MQPQDSVLVFVIGFILGTISTGLVGVFILLLTDRRGGNLPRFPLAIQKPKTTLEDEKMREKLAKSKEYMDIMMGDTVTPEQIARFGEIKQGIRL